MKILTALYMYPVYMYTHATENSSFLTKSSWPKNYFFLTFSYNKLKFHASELIINGDKKRRRERFRETEWINKRENDYPIYWL